MRNSLRYYDERERVIMLSDGLDYPNKVFQLTHVTGLLEQRETIDRLIAGAGVTDARAEARCRVELANYFAAAVLMPYAPFLTEAEAT
ncbi:MAG: ImmA/IrrE family metallo-endopeptidase, partial [Xanthomonadales bacterium]|nr:ImmA/IrrE family metallo-endopeptidase [Xanthomonadales bacterium]